MAGNIKHMILVASGKGGVGKSTVASNLALALAHQGKRTGLLDADIYGPSIPTMLGNSERPGSPDGKTIIPVERYGLKLMSMGYMVDPNAAVIWRGPMLAGAVIQFVNDVDWGELDYLIFDLPPGTGDIQLSLAQKIEVTGSLLVTTPQNVALADVYRAKAMFDKVKIPVLGLIENMSYFVADDGKRYDIFGSGGGVRAAEEMGIPVLAHVPIEPKIRECGDTGEPLIQAVPDSESAGIFRDLAKEMVRLVDLIEADRAKQNRGKNKLRIVQ
ncbi:MAG: Mrp/NBP35 family ATP-binding protein [Myxococcota bacterium]|nr:Mrp/NBP35 family ATP-binding protein [Myxococcota bacterium]